MSDLSGMNIKIKCLVSSSPFSQSCIVIENYASIQYITIFDGTNFIVMLFSLSSFD